MLLICVAALDNLFFTDQLMGTTYHRVQLIWFVIGLISAGLVAALDLSYLRRLGPTMYIVLVVLLLSGGPGAQEAQDHKGGWWEVRQGRALPLHRPISS